MVIREVLEPIEMIQESLEELLKKSRESDDKDMVDGVLMNPIYPDHIVVTVTIALHELDGSDEPFTEEHLLRAITFLDTLDTLNLKVTGK